LSSLATHAEDVDKILLMFVAILPLCSAQLNLANARGFEYFAAISLDVVTPNIDIVCCECERFYPTVSYRARRLVVVQNNLLFVLYGLDKRVDVV
jgi:hypothetical protein